jgi:ribosomal protein S18 acetylase RimI-like enzyme
VAFSLAELRLYIESEASVTLVAEDEENRIGGFIIAQLEPLRKRRRQPSSAVRVGHIVTIDVSLDYRQRGMGTKLLQQAEEWLRRHGVKTVLLETSTDNQAAISFYLKHGYTVVDLLKDYYAKDSHAFLMAKPFDGGGTGEDHGFPSV